MPFTPEQEAEFDAIDAAAASPDYVLTLTDRDGTIIATFDATALESIGYASREVTSDIRENIRRDRAQKASAK